MSFADLSQMPAWWLALIGLACLLNLVSLVVLLMAAKIDRETKQFKKEHGIR